MTSAAFSMSSDPAKRISLRRPAKSPATQTASAADEAIRQVLDRRRQRREDRKAGRDRPGALDGVTTALSDSMSRLGFGPWLFRVVVLAGVTVVLGGAVWAIASSGTARHPIGGVVLVNGKPLANASLVFHRQDEAQPLRREFTTGADGRFKADEPGLPAGVYAVVVTAAAPPARGKKPAAAAIPKAYRDPATTPLRIDLCEALPDLRLLVRR
ncbi:MAG: hypothetical protein ACKOC8_11775 [Pirellulales bacterium]